MKRAFIIGTILALTMSMASAISIGSIETNISKGKDGVEKAIATSMLKRSAATIVKAYQAVKQYKVYTGNLAKAISHQKYAKMLYVQKDFIKASYHALRAKKLAYLALAANKYKAKQDLLEIAEEKSIKGIPTDQELDKSLAQALPNEKIKDEDVMSQEPDSTLPQVK